MSKKKLEPYLNKIHCGDALTFLKTLPDNSIHTIITSPPYWGLRDYNTSPQIWNETENCVHKWNKKTGYCKSCSAWRGELGNEPDYDLFVKNLCSVFDETKRILKDTGSLWVNIGDTYSGSMQGYGVKRDSKTGFQKAPVNAKYFSSSNDKPPMSNCKIPKKSLCLIPFRFAIEMVNIGWILRNTIIWHKPNKMPESVKDRFTNDFEYLFFFTKSEKYYYKQQLEPFRSNEYDQARMKQGRKSYKGKYEKMRQNSSFVAGNKKGRNIRTVWSINTKPLKENHYAAFPEELITTPILATCPKNGIVLDPFLGSGTTAIAAVKNNKKYIGIELNPEYLKIAEKRLKVI